jgi:hypothetical protein
MRNLHLTSARVAALAAAALAVAACSGSESSDNVVANDAGNLILEEPANDASALETAANATEMVPLGNEAEMAPETPETTGGDTGGNSQQGNDVAGM